MLTSTSRRQTQSANIGDELVSHRLDISLVPQAFRLPRPKTNSFHYIILAKLYYLCISCISFHIHVFSTTYCVALGLIKIYGTSVLRGPPPSMHIVFVEYENTQPFWDN